MPTSMVPGFECRMWITPEKAFGQILREMRLARRLSQEKLSFACDLDRTYISLLERGLRSPSLKAILKLAEALEVPPSEIIRRLEDRIGHTPPVDQLKG